MKVIQFNYILFAASAFVLLLLSAFSYRRILAQKSSSDWVSHTYLVKFKVEDAFGYLRDAEAAQHGYLLTGSDAFLDRYYTAIGAIPGAISYLDSLVADNRLERHNLDVFTRLIQQRVTSLTKLIDSTAQVSPERLVPDALQNNSVSDSARAYVELMQHVEDRLLTQRIREKETEERSSLTLVLVFSVFSLITLTGSYIALKKENSLRTQSEDNAGQLEEMVNERTAEIRAINQQLNLQNRALEQRNEELTSFSYVATHDLKEPLRKVVLFADRILSTEGDRLSERGIEYFGRIQESTRRMADLLDALFAYAQTGREAHLQLTDLNTLAQRALDTLQEVIREKEAVVDVGPLPELLVLPQQVEQLFTNLIGNALKYNRPGVPPHVTVSAGRTQLPHDEGGGAYWLLRFADNGIGFDEKYSDKIFQMFQRLHARNEYSGTGIGLAICKKIVDTHHGRISVRSTPGEGSVFEVLLPEDAPKA